MWAQVNELLFKKYFGTRPVTPLHNLYPSKPIFTRPKDGWTGGWLSACFAVPVTTSSVSSVQFPGHLPLLPQQPLSIHLSLPGSTTVVPFTLVSLLLA